MSAASPIRPAAVPTADNPACPGCRHLTDRHAALSAPGAVGCVVTGCPCALDQFEVRRDVRRAREARR